ncbi:hypothetical protein KAFR_0A06160 [Kazachstania africana CBS 2517]|uniref:F-box domain-containing protein n=1 Tax=Kazachstania africana (strain ATCC 22294 / BCRC 22015 / CBS 2517 / CECT 1963 / NBRC 1671 / NRRL Y-8276) TaxID=1071382 RepID=H2ANV1_KAZAF|nr:hypothetical protein KAFR_0A06160 [Kazachstania africana CBS 2517]CCF56051.1 hypothetical protein KAFR_0A06160 [Kazachstania africana CBS 2517]
MSAVASGMECLPQEVWFVISFHLELEDLLNLRITSKILNGRIKYYRIWRYLCHVNWIQHELDYGGDLSALYPHDNNNWYNYFKYRYVKDMGLLKALNELSQLSGQDAYYKQFIKIVETNNSDSDSENHLLPLLSRISSTDLTYGRYTFDIAAIAQELLSAMRHKHFFKILFIDDSGTYTPEEVFIKLSAMDQSFDNLLHQRTVTYHKVNSKLKEFYKQTLRDSFLKLPSSLRVDKILSILLEILRPTFISSHYYLEDMMILRVYANEAKGHPLVLLAMVQSIAAKYRVRSYLSKNYLIIKDDELRDKESYLTISVDGDGGFKPKLFTRTPLIKSLVQHLPYLQNDETLLNNFLKQFFKVLTNKDLVDVYFDELLPKTLNKSHSELCRDLDTKVRLFPYSLKPVSVGTVDYFISVRNSLKTPIIPVTRTISTLVDEELSKFIDVAFPSDITYLKGIKPDYLVCVSSYKDWLYRKYSIIIPENANLRSMIGKFIRSKRDKKLLCIAGVKSTHINLDSVESSQFYYIVINDLGEFYVELSKNVEDYEWHRDEIEQFLKMNSPASELGLVFKNVDWENHKLVLNDRIKKSLS